MKNPSAQGGFCFDLNDGEESTNVGAYKLENGLNMPSPRKESLVKRRYNFDDEIDNHTVRIVHQQFIRLYNVRTFLISA